MKAGTKFFVVTVILVTVVGSWFYVRSRLGIVSAPKPTPSAPVVKTPTVFALYTSSKYGFSFSYPNTLELTEYNPEQINIGRKGSVRVTPLVEVSIIKSSPEIQVQSFDEFVLEAAREACSYKTATIELSCNRLDDIAKIKPYTSSKGAKGQVFYLKGEEKDIKTGKTMTARRGPFYTFNTTARTPNHMSFLMINNPVQTDVTSADLGAIESIADSVFTQN